MSKGHPNTVTISTRSAERIRDWLRDMGTALHMAPKQNEYDAFIELHGAIEDSHYAEKRGTLEDDEATEE